MLLILAVFTQVSTGQSVHSIVGFGNNLTNPEWGAVGDIQPRISPADFADGISQPKFRYSDHLMFRNWGLRGKNENIIIQDYIGLDSISTKRKCK